MTKIYLILFTLILGAMVFPKAQAQTCPDNIVFTADTDDCTTFIDFDGPEGAWYVYSGATMDTTEYSQGQFYSDITYADVYDGHPDTGTWICQFEIEVDDQTDPTAVCQGITIEIDATGNVTFPASNLDGGTTDNCSDSLIFTVDGSEDITYDCNDVGQTYEVTLVVTDPGGNSDECPANITIEDNIPPVATCDGGVISLDAAGVTVRALDYETASSDNCGIDDSWFVVNGENFDQLTFDCSSHGVDSIVYYVVQDPQRTERHM